ncbi:MAG: RNA polymerase sigma factor [Polyangiales bacterium]
MDQPALPEPLFRREAGRMVATLTRVFGVHNLALAEDVVQDALCRALEVWKLRGVPDDPAAWLMATAKNRALDVLRKERTARTFGPELGRQIESEWTLAPAVADLVEPSALRDDELRRMFSCWQPRLGERACVALILNVLCGFGAREIASAFLEERSAIEKRISRGKRALAGSKRLFDVAAAPEVSERLPTVQRALYLLFNEGYHGGSPDAVRIELCRDAMRLARLLVDHPATATPSTCALAAVMCLNAARLPARIGDDGGVVPLAEQDRSRWDATLIDEGRRLLDRAATGEEVSEYHLEAAIAAVHADASTAAQTRWDVIVSLYDARMALDPSPVIALARAIAIAEDQGAPRGLEALAAIEGSERLSAYPFYAASLGELELRCGRPEVAREHYRRALALARNAVERRSIERRLEACDEAGAGTT